MKCKQQILMGLSSTCKFGSRRFVVCKLYFLFDKNMIFIFSVVFLVQRESDFYIQCTTLA